MLRVYASRILALDSSSPPAFSEPVPPWHLCLHLLLRLPGSVLEYPHGYTGNISLGHSLYVGIGAYLSTVLAISLGLSPWVGWLSEVWEPPSSVCSWLFAFRFGLKKCLFCSHHNRLCRDWELIALHLKPLGQFMGLFIDFRPGWANFQFKRNLPYYYIGLGFVVFSLAVVKGIEVSKIGALLRCPSRG